MSEPQIPPAEIENCQRCMHLVREARKNGLRDPTPDSLAYIHVANEHGKPR